MWKTLSSGEILCRVQNHVFASDEYKCEPESKKIPVNEAIRFSNSTVNEVGVLAKFVFNKALLYLFH